MRPALVLAAVSMLLVAGCSAVPDGSRPSSATDTATTAGTTNPSETTRRTTDATSSEAANDPSAERGVDVDGGSLPYDANVTFRRVERMLGVNASAPDVTIINGLDAAGQATATGQVYLNTENEAVLAHEFAHSILLRRYDLRTLGSTDEQFAINGVVEGAAEYVESAYADRYLDRASPGFSRLPVDPAEAYYFGRYYFGYEYFRERLDSASRIEAVYANPPRTSEQLIHAYAPGAEPVENLTVHVADANLDANASWRFTGTQRVGEITVLLTLRTRLGNSAAVRGAAGWGNDRLVEFEHGRRRGFVWVIRWDDAANATEFADAFDRYVASAPRRDGSSSRFERSPNAEFTDLVWDGTDAAFDLRRVGDETTAVFVGPEPFVENASATGTDAAVDVSVA